MKNYNMTAAKTSSGKIDKYEYLTGEKTLNSNQRQIIEQARFTYFSLGKSFEKQTKTTEEQGEKQVKAFENRFEKKIFRHRSKISHFFVFKRFSK